MRARFKVENTSGHSERFRGPQRVQPARLCERSHLLQYIATLNRVAGRARSPELSVTVYNCTITICTFTYLIVCVLIILLFLFDRSVVQLDVVEALKQVLQWTPLYKPGLNRALIQAAKVGSVGCVKV